MIVQLNDLVLRFKSGIKLLLLAVLSRVRLEPIKEQLDTACELSLLAPLIILFLAHSIQVDLCLPDLGESSSADLGGLLSQLLMVLLLPLLFGT